MMINGYKTSSVGTIGTPSVRSGHLSPPRASLIVQHHLSASAYFSAHIIHLSFPSMTSKHPGELISPEQIAFDGLIEASIIVVSGVSENQTVVFCNLTKNLSTKSTALSFPKFKLPIEFLNF